MATLMIRRPSLLETFDTIFGPIYTGERCIDMDVYEAKDELIVKAELPGVSKDSFDIRLDGDTLRIEAEKKGEEMQVDADRSYLCEREFGRYSRTLSLPFPVDTSKVTSTYENGVLEIRLPKAEEAKSKQISVTVK